MFVIDDIIWLDAIIEKLIWKHQVLTSEVEELLTGQCRIFKKESGKVEGEYLYNALGRTKGGRLLSIYIFHPETKQQGVNYNRPGYE